MLKSIGNLIGANKVIDSLMPNDGLYDKVKTFRNTNAEHSELINVQKALRHAEDSGDYNKRMRERSSELSDKIASTRNDNKKERLRVRKNQVDDALKRAGSYPKTSVDAKADRGKTARKAQRDAMKKPSADLRNGVADYFKGDGDAFNATMRIGAATAATGVAAVGVRYANGGTATVNNQGQRDIAGIPFV